MSRLEDHVKPIVVGLLGDKPVTLDRDDQTTLAVWAVKNAMVYEALRLEAPWFFANSERRLYANRCDYCRRRQYG